MTSDQKTTIRMTEGVARRETAVNPCPGYSTFRLQCRRQEAVRQRNQHHRLLQSFPTRDDLRGQTGSSTSADSEIYTTDPPDDLTDIVRYTPT